MSSMFTSVERAKEVAASMIGVEPSSFKEVPGLHAYDMGSMLLEDPETSLELKNIIQNRINAQKGFKTMKDGKEIQIVISPFRDGFDCWFVRDNGSCLRI